MKAPAARLRQPFTCNPFAAPAPAPASRLSAASTSSFLCTGSNTPRASQKLSSSCLVALSPVLWGIADGGLMPEGRVLKALRVTDAVPAPGLFDTLMVANCLSASFK